MTKRNYKSDFDCIVRFKDDNDPEGEKTIPWPEFDWYIVFWTASKANTYTASCRAGVYTNCFPTEDGGMHFVFNNHRLGPGVLQWEPHFELPNDIYPDNIQDLFSRHQLGIELVTGAGFCPSTAEVEAILPYIKGDKGDPFTAEDFTQEQWADLQRPATEAAQSMARLEKTVTEAETQRQASEESRQKAEQTRQADETARVAAEESRAGAETRRAEAEQARATSESARKTAEEARQTDETARQRAETLRVSAEEARAKAETERVSAENLRKDAETRRVSAESERVAAEKARQTAEETRGTHEQARINAESTRQTQETARQTAETRRKSDESERVTAEEARAQAETKRQAAENLRAEEFSSWHDELDSKAERSELSNIVGVPTQEEIEALDPTLVTEALRKVPQALTDAEKSQVLKNLGNPEMKTFIDMWNMAFGAHGKYDPINAPDPQHPFFGNKIWMTYEEALAVMDAGHRQTSTLSAVYISSPIRTHLPRFGSGQAANAEYTFYNCTRLEIVEMLNLTLLGDVFTKCPNLRSIGAEQALYCINGSAKSNFSGCRALVTLKGAIRGNFDINLVDCPLLSRESFEYMVEHAYNTSPITITLHPDAYARLSDELMAQAAEKNITFATA